MKKLFIILLAFATLLTAVACSGNGNDNSNTNPQQSEDEDYPLPIVNYNGAEFRVSLMHSGAGHEFYIESDSTSPTESALYRRNVTVQDRYSVKITPVITGGKGEFGHTTAIVNTILAEEDDYDLVTSYAFAAGPLIMNTCLLDLGGMENINLDASYWVKDINDKFIIEDHLYTAVGDTSVFSLMYTYAMMFNRSKGDAYEITEEVFEKIDNMEWTIDYFSTLVSGIHDDIDNVPGKSYDDFYGFRAETETNLDNYNFAFDIPMMDNSAENESVVEFVYGGERLAKAVDKIVDLYWSNSGSVVSGDHIAAFTQGKAMFSTILLNDCFTYLKNMEDDYIILPYPMLDDTQDGYRTGMMDNYHVMGIPKTVTNVDMVSLITEALNYEGEKTLYKVYFEESLQGKFVRDERTIEMLNILLEGRTADFGTLIQKNVDNVSVWFRWMVQQKNKDTVGFIDYYYDSVTAKLEAVIDKYREGA